MNGRPDIAPPYDEFNFVTTGIGIVNFIYFSLNYVLAFLLSFPVTHCIYLHTVDEDLAKQCVDGRPFFMTANITSTRQVAVLALTAKLVLSGNGCSST